MWNEYFELYEGGLCSGTLRTVQGRSNTRDVRHWTLTVHSSGIKCCEGWGARWGGGEERLWTGKIFSIFTKNFLLKSNFRQKQIVHLFKTHFLAQRNAQQRTIKLRKDIPPFHACQKNPRLLREIIYKDESPGPKTLLFVFEMETTFLSLLKKKLLSREFLTFILYSLKEMRAN